MKNLPNRQKLIEIFSALLKIDDIEIIKCVLESLIDELSEIEDNDN